MKYEEMKSAVNAIETLEQYLMRPLTEDERHYVIRNGLDSFISDKLKFSDADITTFNTLKQILSTYCTLPSTEFDKLLNENLGAAVYVLETILNAIQEEKIKRDQANKSESCKCKKKESDKTDERETACFYPSSKEEDVKEDIEDKKYSTTDALDFFRSLWEQMQEAYEQEQEDRNRNGHFYQTVHGQNR